MDTKLIELNSCPFCGGAARVVDSSYSGSAIHVSCRCGAQMFGGRQHFGSESEAAAAWNLRTVGSIEMHALKAFSAEMLARANDSENSLSDDVRAGMRTAAAFADTYLELKNLSDWKGNGTNE
ncbi:TPA: Lar family restriction alleviation protein [Serratia marcescens]|uniref:Lar family restriction alleviation protein n=1 Tax=Serratia marcescens TaxID=615 RepID=UPI0036FF6FBC